jgi:hypothetical protein
MMMLDLDGHGRDMGMNIRELVPYGRVFNLKPFKPLKSHFVVSAHGRLRIEVKVRLTRTLW